LARLSDIRLRRSAVSGSIPSTSNLNLGELALNTADGKVYMKKSVGGTDSVVEVGGSSSGITSTFTAYEYTATANQTTFSGSDNYSNTLAYNTGTPPKVQVFMNGILLDEGSSQDYTGTNGTSVVLTTGADAGDLIQIHAYKSDVSVSSNINFGDNKKLQFGDAQDLQIYHDGNNSRVEDTGTGGLRLIGGNFVSLQSTSGENMVVATENGAVTLYHNNSAKLATTSTGVQTTGTVNVNGAYTLPTSDGSSGQALVSDGSGTLSFATVSGGAVTSMSDTDGDTKIQVEESSDEDKIRFDTAGVERVRIGVDSSSDSTLEIVRNGVPAAQGQLTFNGSGLVTNVASGYHSLIVKNGSSEHLRVRSNGNVGIGESSPSQKLQVNGNIRADGHYYVGGQIVIDSNRRILAADGAANVPYITFAADTNTGLYRPGTDILGFSTAGSERVRIDASGRVGINQSNPSHKLQVSVDANGAFIKRDLTSNAANLSEFNSNRSLLLLNRNAGSYLAFGGNGSRTDIQATDLAGTPTAKNIALNPFGGNVGIGTDNPQVKLQVNDSGTAVPTSGYGTGFNVSRADGLIGMTMGYLSTNNTMYIQGRNFTNTDSQPISLNPNGGNIGIGTSSPTEILTLDDTNPKLALRDAGTERAFLQVDSADNFVINNKSISSMIFETSDTERMRIDSSGNLLVGTTDSSVWNNGAGGNTGTVIESDGTIQLAKSNNITAYFNRLNSDGEILSFRKNGAGVGSIGTLAGDLLVGTGNTGLLFYDADPQIIPRNPVTGANVDATVDLGATGSRFKDLYLSGVANGAGFQSNQPTNGFGYVNFGDTDDANIGQIGYDHTNNYMRFQVNNTEKARIDSSGNLLVGTTNAANASTGFRAYAGGNGAFTRASTVLDLNRLSSDGTIIQFQKDTVNVGSIGTAGSDIYIAGLDSNHAALRFAASVKAVLPVTHTGALNDNTTNLGQSNARFKDLHLSGKAHIGHAVIDDYAVNTSATSAAQVDTFAAATFRTARYTIQITNTTDSTYHVTELLLIHDGTTPSITEYGTIYTGGAAEATFDADIVSGNVRLLATPASSDTMQFKVVRHSILV